MNPSLFSRLEGIQEILMAHHSAGRKFPSATKGNEREVLVREFLSKVLPPPFRFGSGAIIDNEGRSTGQLDIVVEFPILPSFPTPGAPERLYLADSVAFVIEVKSNISAQWQELEAKASQLAPLRRSWKGHLHFGIDGEMKMQGPSKSRIPLVAVGFEGYATVDSLADRLKKTDSTNRPDSALVLKSGAYISRVSGATVEAIGAAGLFALCTDAAYFARNVMVAHPDIAPYF
jgi:hypothetical protein